MSAIISCSLHVGNMSDPSHTERIAEIASRGRVSDLFSEMSG